MFQGPSHAQPGAFRCVAIDLASAGLAQPFDVKWMPDADSENEHGMLAVTSHTAAKRRSGALNQSNLSFFTVGGRLLRTVVTALFNEPNMMALE